MVYPIVDLHCDLLAYLCQQPGRTPWDPAPRCSIPQLKEGHVQLQTLAIYAATAETSVEKGKRQVATFQELNAQFPGRFIAAFENASGFALENEPLSTALSRLESYCSQLGPLFYISLTWDGENRFGGGVGAQCGLKRDGKDLMEWLNGKKIAIDLSHASDPLAEDVFNHIDAKGYDIPVIASHSNFRSVTDHPRNLPEPIAKEIIRRKGLIGLNFIASFLHRTDPSAFLRHIEYGLALGAEEALCFGADFFCDADFPTLFQKHQTHTLFLPGYDDASRYPHILAALASTLKLPPELLSKIAHGNALRFLGRG